MHEKRPTWMGTRRHEAGQHDPLLPEQRELPLGDPTPPPELRLFAPTDDAFSPLSVPQQRSLPLGSGDGGGGPTRLTPELRLEQFFDAWVRPKVHAHSSPKTLKEYRTTFAYWAQLTGDPPVGDVGEPTIEAFVEGIKAVLFRGQPLSENTIRKHCVNVQAVLTVLGPKAKGNKFGAALVRHVPYVPAPAAVVNENIDEYSLAEVGQVLDACRRATGPRKASRVYRVELPTFWESLVTFTYNAGLRIESSLFLRFSWLAQDELGWWLRIPAGAMKGRRQGRVIYLNSHALAAIERMRGGSSDLIFGGACSYYVCNANLQRILRRSSLPPERQFGMHSLRKTFLTELTKINPAAAKKAACHGKPTGDVTLDHYTSKRIVIAAVDQLPQPPRASRVDPQRRLF